MTSASSCCCRLCVGGWSRVGASVSVGRGPSGPESRTSSGSTGRRCRSRSAFSARLLAMVNSQVENLAFGVYFFARAVDAKEHFLREIFGFVGAARRDGA